MHDYYIDDDGDAEEAAWGDEEETKKKCKVKKLFCISLTRAWDVVLCIFDSTREPQKSLYWSCNSHCRGSRWISCETTTLSLLCYSEPTKNHDGFAVLPSGYSVLQVAGRAQPRVGALASQKERELPIPCNFRRSRCLGKWAATVWRRRWNSWKIKHSRAITNNLLALHHPENALFLRNWLQSSLVLYTKDYTWPIISSSRLLKANHPFCSCRNPILISQKIRSWAHFTYDYLRKIQMCLQDYLFAKYIGTRLKILFSYKTAIKIRFQRIKKFSVMSKSLSIVCQHWVKR